MIEIYHIQQEKVNIADIIEQKEKTINFFFKIEGDADSIEFPVIIHFNSIKSRHYDTLIKIRIGPHHKCIENIKQKDLDRWPIVNNTDLWLTVINTIHDELKDSCDIALLAVGIDDSQEVLGKITDKILSTIEYHVKQLELII